MMNIGFGPSKEERIGDQMCQKYSWKWNEELTKQLKSGDPQVAKRAWERLTGETYPDFLSYFSRYQKTNYTDHSRVDYAWELTQQLWTDMFSRLSLGKGLPSNANVEGYVKTMAKNLVIEEWRKRRKERVFEDIDSLAIDKKPRSELWYIDKEHNFFEVTEDIALLCSHLDGDWERFYAHLNRFAGLKPTEIYALTGEPMKEIRNTSKRVRRKLENMKPEISHYRSKPGLWEQGLGFTGDYCSPFTVNLFNVRLRNLDQDSRDQILCDLDLKTMHQLRENFIVFVQISGISCHKPQHQVVTVIFAPRVGMGRAVLEHKEVYYAEYTPFFESGHINGKKGRILHLTNKLEYSGFVREELILNNEGEPVGWEWPMPGRGLTALKAYNPEILPILTNPNSQKKTVNLLRVYRRLPCIN